jgi:hypothetical protein
MPNVPGWTSIYNTGGKFGLPAQTPGEIDMVTLTPQGGGGSGTIDEITSTYLTVTNPTGPTTNVDLPAPGTAGNVLTSHSGIWASEPPTGGGGTGTTAYVVPNSSGIADYQVLNTDTFVMVDQTPTNVTTVAAGDNGTALSALAGTLQVVSSSVFTSTGQVTVVTSGGPAVLAYTGKGTGTFTGVTIVSGTGSWTLATGYTVTQPNGTQGLGRIVIDLSTTSPNKNIFTSAAYSFTSNDVGRPCTAAMIGGTITAISTVSRPNDTFTFSGTPLSATFYGAGYNVGICGSVITLPDATAYPAGQTLTIQKIDTSLGMVQIYPKTGQTLGAVSGGLSCPKVSLLNTYWTNQQQSSKQPTPIYGRWTDAACYKFVANTVNGTPNWAIVDYPKLIGQVGYGIESTSSNFTPGSQGASQPAQPIDYLRVNGLSYTAPGSGISPGGLLYFSPGGDTNPTNFCVVGTMPHTGMFRWRLEMDCAVGGTSGAMQFALNSDFTGNADHCHGWDSTQQDVVSLASNNRTFASGHCSGYDTQGPPWTPQANSPYGFMPPGELIFAAFALRSDVSGTTIVIENAMTMLWLEAC